MDGSHRLHLKETLVPHYGSEWGGRYWWGYVWRVRGVSLGLVGDTGSL